MKTLYNIIEELEGVSTPGNTMGMGDPMMPSVTDGEPGTEPYITAKSEVEKPKRKRKKKYKECDKSLKEQLVESLLDDEEDMINDESVVNEVIKNWILTYYDVIPARYGEVKWDIKNNIVNLINAQISNKDDLTTITNGNFRFGVIDGNMTIAETNIMDLTGAPTEVRGNFICNDNDNLKSLKGCPQKINGNLILSYNKKLKDFTTLPSNIYVGKHIIAQHNKNLVSTKGLPSIINGDLYLNNNPKLKDINGVQKVKGMLNIQDSDIIVKKYLNHEFNIDSEGLLYDELPF